MHRTTIELDDKLLRTLKEICVHEGRKFKHLVLELIRSGLQIRTNRRRLSVRGLTAWHTGKASLPRGIDPADRATYTSYLERRLR